MKYHQPKIIIARRNRWAAVTAALALIVSVAPAHAQTTITGVNVYQAVPGLAGSDKYSVKVCATSNQSVWNTVFTWRTSVPTTNPDVPGTADSEKYYKSLRGWSHSYVNFEMSVPVTIEITKIGGSISTAAVHPARKVSNVYVSGGKAYLTMANPCNVAVDIDNQMNNRYTGDGVTAGLAPIHTISIHGNPVLNNKPNLGDSSVLAVEPGATTLPAFSGSQTTMYFKPGVHNLGRNVPLYPNKQYYIPGDAIVYATFSNHDVGIGNPIKGDNIRIFGHGTISGSQIRHWSLTEPGISNPDESKSYLNRTIDIDDAKNSTLEGVTITDPSYHSIILGSFAPDPAITNTVKWVKTLTWRVNGDGGGAGENNVVTNCFHRTQDDGLYVHGRTVSENVLWSDVNGTAMRLSFLPNLTPPATLNINNMDAIYTRHNGWSRSSPLQLPEDATGSHGTGVTFSNITVSDFYPNGPAISIVQYKPGTFAGATFNNITIATQQNMTGQGTIISNQKNILSTNSTDPQNPNPIGTGIIGALTFKNLVIGGVPVTNANWTNYFDAVGTVTTPSFTSDITYINYALTASGGTTGSVALNPSNINNSYVSGTDVMVKSVPTTGNTFSYWSGSLSGAANPSIISMNAAKSVTANTIPALSRAGWTASDSTGGNATYAIDGVLAPRWSTNAFQIPGQWLKVDMGSPKTFNKIGLDGSFANSNDFPVGYNVEVSSDNSIWTSVATGIGNPGITTISFPTQTKRFIRVTQTGTSGAYWSMEEFYVYAPVILPTFTLTKTATNGTVTLNPATGPYTTGTMVTVTATPNAGYAFTSWSGGSLTGNANPTAVTMDANKTITANFTPTYTLTATSPNGSVTFNPPGPTYISGTVVTVTANPIPGYVFTDWSDGLTSSVNPTTITMDANKSITANMVNSSGGGTALSRTSWTATASAGNSDAGKAFDKDTSFRWSTSTDQVSGQWYRLNLGSAQTFSKIVLDSAGSPNDYPRGYTVEVSSNGTNWTLVTTTGSTAAGVTTINFATQTANYIRVTQTGSAAGNWWSIHEFYVYAPLPPSPWQTADIGTVGIAGSFSYTSPTWTIAGAGADIWNGVDAFRYVYQSSSDNCSVVARVTGITNTDLWAKAGVMIRESTAANAINALVCVTPGNGVSFQWRTTTGSGSSFTQVAGLTTPMWLKITRTGNSFVASYSSNGTWIQVGVPQTITMATSALIGMAVTSHNVNTLCTSTMDNVTPTP